VARGTASVRLVRLLRTSSFRLTLIYAAVFSVSVLLLFGVVALSATGIMARQIDGTVANELAEVQADAAGKGEIGLRDVVAQISARSPGIYYLLQDSGRRVLAGNMGALRSQPGLRRLSEVHYADGHSVGGIRGQGVLLQDGSYLFVGLSSFQLDELREVIARAFLAAVVVIICLAIAGGLLTSTAVLRRIDAIGRTSREIMAGDLGRRIALRGTNDEFDRLAASLNAMLERIQNLMSGLQQVSNDIAHDLRTPLTRLRQRLELALRREATVDGLRAALEGSITDTDAILATFSALLRIAQIEAGTRKSAFTMVDLRRLLEELVETYQLVAEEREQVLSIVAGQPITVLGDPELLVQLFANLIENAIHHSPRSTAIEISAKVTGMGVEAVVSDNGPGIPAQLRTKVLERFTRIDTSRSTPGSGLGMSLVVAITTLHDATLELHDNMPGLRCVLRFPRLPH
jgi:signal transduction histidine kinase